MTDKKKDKEQFCTNLRIPKSLSDKIKKAARSSNRSLNGEINQALLERYK